MKFPNFFLDDRPEEIVYNTYKDACGKDGDPCSIVLLKKLDNGCRNPDKRSTDNWQKGQDLEPMQRIAGADND